MSTHSRVSLVDARVAFEDRMSPLLPLNGPADAAALTRVAARPFGVALLSAFFAFGTLASALATVSLLAPGGRLEPMWRLNPRGHAGLVALGVWGPLILGAACLACACAAYGFANGRPWGYRLGVGLLLVNLAGDLVNVTFGIEPRAIVGVPIVAGLLWYLSSKTVKTYFCPAVKCAA
jgi:hypothetical protein